MPILFDILMFGLPLLVCLLLCYRKVPMEEAHIRIGPGNAMVTTCGGYFKFPFLCSVVVVPLRTFALEITEPPGIDQTRRLKGMVITFHVKYDKDAMLTVARKLPDLGKPGAEIVRSVLEERLQMVLAGIRDIRSINLHEKEEEVDEVLARFGLYVVALAFKEGEEIINPQPYR